MGTFNFMIQNYADDTFYPLCTKRQSQNRIAYNLPVPGASVFKTHQSQCNATLNHRITQQNRSNEDSLTKGVSTFLSVSLKSAFLLLVVQIKNGEQEEGKGSPSSKIRSKKCKIMDIQFILKPSFCYLIYVFYS